jgi:hypothetical protein
VAGLQATLYKPSGTEQRREVACEVCKGNRLVCLRNPSRCPVFLRAKKLVDLEKAVSKTSFFGPSPPGVFLGSFGYPHVLAGPLVPAVVESDPSILDSPDRWLDKPMDQLIRYRFALVRGKSLIRVQSATNPDRTLSLVQEMVMSEKPTDTELLLKKKPRIRINLLPRSAPHGPSGVIENLSLASNPSVPRPIERVVGDSDLGAESGAYVLYKSGVSQQQITRIFSTGLLGVRRNRRLVPTEWSITAVDDILAKGIRSRIGGYPPVAEFQVFGAEALGNNVRILLLPTSWMYEALEGWLTGPRPQVYMDYELNKGRTNYPANLAGAYHAAKLPVLEYLDRERRQAGAIAFLEVYQDWVPLGVWRFRELARRALSSPAFKTGSLEQALSQVWRNLRIPAAEWLRADKLLGHYKKQALLDLFAR